MTTSKILSSLSRWPLFLTFSAFVFASHILPPEEWPPFAARVNDKATHFLNFFILALLAYRTFIFSTHSFFSTRAESKACGFSLFYGALLELIQVPLVGRDASGWDWLADAAGAALALVIFRISRLTPPG